MSKPCVCTNDVQLMLHRGGASCVTPMKYMTCFTDNNYIMTIQGI